MDRWLRYILLGVSLIVFLSSAGLWVRSYWILDEWTLARSGIHEVCSLGGGVHLFVRDYTEAVRSWAWDRYTLPQDATLAELHACPPQWSFLGFAYVDSVTVGPGAGRVILPVAPIAAPRPRLVPWLTMVPYRAWIVPYWFILLLSGAIPLRAGVRLIQRVYRRRHRCCPNCGYDLRASTAICPECGERFESAAQR